jgi:hypothetical protein
VHTDANFLEYYNVTLQVRATNGMVSLRNDEKQRRRARLLVQLESIAFPAVFARHRDEGTIFMHFNIISNT